MITHTIEEKINNIEKTCFKAIVRLFVIGNSLIRIED
jgi:hypothetical protein